MLIPIPLENWQSEVWRRLQATKENDSLNNVLICSVYYHCSECQTFRSLNGLHFSVLSLYPDFVQNWAWFCFTSFRPQPTKTNWRHFLMFCIPVISQSKDVSPQKLTYYLFYLCWSLTDFCMIAGIIKIAQHTRLWWFLRLLRSLNFDFHVIA